MLTTYLLAVATVDQLAIFILFSLTARYFTAILQLMSQKS